MHLDNLPVTYTRAALHLEDLRQKTEAYQAGKVTPLKKSYRSRLAELLNKLAERLEPNLKNVDAPSV